VLQRGVACFVLYVTLSQCLSPSGSGNGPPN
jgi:hypothetical protein